jgi:hypothetical protein
MNNVSMNQALSIWSELWQAYYGDNSYGSDTAEIYAYRVMPYSPALLMAKDSQIAIEEGHELARLSACSMRNLVWQFCKEADCKCLIDGEDCDTWLAHNPEFDYRCHVKVVRK